MTDAGRIWLIRIAHLAFSAELVLCGLILLTKHADLSGWGALLVGFASCMHTVNYWDHAGDAK